MKYRIGLDIGIGSIGWAVVSGEKETARIEDFGVRIFESGEKENGKSRTSQERRGFRGSRRLIRRRHYRKFLLKNHLENIGLLNTTFNDDLVLCKDEDVYELKTKALDEKLSVAQLYKCLVHTCNHRGYRDFYETDDADDDESVNKKAVHDFESRFNESNKRTVSEYLFCECREGGFVRFRNRNFGKEDYLLINRKLLKDEVEKILEKQSEYYPELNKNNIESIEKIIFNQRDFEDGPGNPDDKFRRYKGFLETLGTCPFYKDETRGFRSTIISDVFAVTNTLSQYRFVNNETGEYDLPKEIAEELVNHLLSNANLTMTEVKNILKSHNYTLLKSEKSDDKALAKAIKYLKIAKKSVEQAGFEWKDFISEEQFDISSPSKLHQIGEIISKFQTPSRRRNEFESLSFATPELIKAFSGKKISGTAKASYKYMCEAITAFKSGDIYGNFQANFNKNTEEVENVEKVFKLATKHIDDKEIRNNPVVFKSINETRKIVNAIIDVYGSPETIVVEVASDLSRSFSERMELLKHQKSNEKTNDIIKQKISELLDLDVAEIKPVMVDKYKLYEQQQGKSLYSGKALGEIIDVLKDDKHIYEIDHIVPYSLILDNTLNNKALVYYEENQLKGQRTPLMYLDDAEKDEFVKRVNYLYTKKMISDKKLKYLKLESIYTQEAKDLLSNWKSRNINDTRYITKYIISIFRKYLKFNGDKKQPVFAVKGGMTSKFRKIWLNDCVWGDEEKNRDTYLNHAVDAVVVANLTPAYIEIASDSLKLRSIYYKHRKTLSGEYNDYLNKCVDKMEKYYGFSKEYTQKLLRNTERVPSYIPRLSAEIQARFKDEDIEDFNKGIKRFYGDNAEFIVQPQMPITSHKQNKKFKGAIADSKLIKVVTIDGNTYKIKRDNVKDLKKSELKNLYTNDLSLRKTLEKIFEEYDTVEKYMKANNIDKFITISGQPIYKVSVIEKAVSNYYKKNIDDNNYGYLGGLKYYCIEVYKNVDGKTKTHGIRYVDMVKKNKKLYQKQESLPADYSEHMTYLFHNDYIKVYNGKNELKFEGFYKSVHSITRSLFYFQSRNLAPKTDVSIKNKDIVKKYNINLLGKLGGEIKCSEPWSLISEKK